MKKCPNCGSEEFYVTAHVTQDWLVDKNGEFIQVEDNCVEVTHHPNNEDIWCCADCGYNAPGEEFEVEEEEVKEVKKYTIDSYKEFCNNALVLPPLDEFDDGSIDEKKWYETHKIHITVDNHDMELDYYADSVTEIYDALKEMYEIEMEIRGMNEDKKEEEDDSTMVNTEFKTKLTEAFKKHMFMKDREQHTVNELLYVLEHHGEFGGEDFNISIKTLDNNWWSIPCLDAFVTTHIREMWFNDEEVVFEIDECGEEKFNCITLYECEREVNE